MRQEEMDDMLRSKEARMIAIRRVEHLRPAIKKKLLSELFTKINPAPKDRRV